MSARRHGEPARSLKVTLDVLLAVRRTLTDRVGPSGRRVFVALALHPSSSIGEIARLIAVSDSIASRAVSQLIKFGLVEVAVDQKERRRHLVQLTEPGERIAQEIARLVRDICTSDSKFKSKV